jgi:hypothetical protein
MTRQEIRVNLTRWGSAVALLGGLWLLVTALRSEADDRYVRRNEYRETILQIQGDIRVMRCEVVKDCGAKP